MSKDIRSFFNVISKKSAPGNSSEKPSKSKSKCSKLIISDSSDEETEKQPKQKHSLKRKVQMINSDSEDESKKTKKKEKTPKKRHTFESKQSPKKLKPINIEDAFSNKPITQSKVELPIKSSNDKEKVEKPKLKKLKKKKATTEVGIHGDDDFDKTLLELDDDVFLNNVDFLDKSIDEALSSNRKKSKEMQEKPAEKDETVLETSKKRESSATKQGSSHETPSKKAKLEHIDSGIDPGQEAHEKKVYSAMLYQKYLHRGEPKHLGQKKLPEGKPNCLANLCFLRTGVLESLDSELFENLVKKHGGRVVHGVSKKVNYIVVGEEPGPSKLEKAKNYNIPQISEDELLDMILVKSGMEKKYTATDPSEDPGMLGDGFEVDKTAIAPDDKSDKKTTEDEKGKKKKEKYDRTKAEENETSSSKENSPKNKYKKNEDIRKKVETGKTPLPHRMVKKEGTESKTETNENNFIGSDSVSSKTRVEDLALTEKYKPKDTKGIIGQQTDVSNMNKLKRWLSNWYKNQEPQVRKKLIRPSPWAKNDDGAYFKCALLSGPPGVGKTTTATLVAKELGFDVVEFNASDTRSKKLLHEEVSQLLNTTTIAGYAHGKEKTDKRRVLLMDEVDGMAGNEDRGGIQELINLIKTTSIPIICMCNDRNHQKMRSLVNYCFDLRFARPKPQQILGFIMSICCKEGIKMNPNVASEVINGTNCDIRQTLNHLAMLAATKSDLTLEMAQKEAQSAKKDSVLGPWEVCRMVFSKAEHKNMSIGDKSRLFFYDYSMGPLFVQENYLKVKLNVSKEEALKRAAAAADAISMGDIIDSTIRGSNNWSLLENQAMYSSVLPGHYMSGEVSCAVNFPSWLGKNSKRNKFNRLLNEIQIHTRTKMSGNKMSVKLDYIKPLLNAIITPLKRDGMSGVQKAVDVMKTYELLREDLDNLAEISTWGKQKNPMADIDSKVKSSFTRTYNKEVALLPFAPSTGVSKKKASAADDMLEEDLASEPESDDNIDADALIKVKVKKSEKDKKVDKGKISKKAGSSKSTSTKTKKK